MIAVVAEIPIKAGKEKEYLAQAEKVVAATRKEAGCISYECCQSVENKLKFAMAEKWKDKEALDAHMQTDHFKAFISGIGDLTDGDTVIEVYSVLI